METQFTQGATVYDGQGREYLYDAAVTVSDGGVAHVVTPLLAENTEGDPTFGDAIVLAEVFASPPVARWNADIEGRKARLVELDKAVSEAYAKMRTAHEQNAAILKLAERFKGQTEVFDTLLRFVSGDVTHVVVGNERKIVEARNVSGLSIGWHRTDGFTGAGQWSVTLYDGTERLRFVPCKSLDEAKAELARSMEHDEIGYWTEHVIENANRHGVPVPAALLERVKQFRLAERQRNVEHVRAQLADAEAKLAALTK